MEITVTTESGWAVSLAGDRVDIVDPDGIWAGTGWWDGASDAIEDCPADIDERTYAELEAALARRLAEMGLGTDSALLPLRVHDTWTVCDLAGGQWWPSAEADADIEAAADPAARAVEICEREPMRGEWNQ